MSIQVTPIPITSMAHSQLTDVLSADHHYKYTDAEAQAQSGLIREGGQSTEGTTTSTSVVDLITASSLTIAAIQFFEIKCLFRKTAGAASGAGFGLKLNTTAVAVPIATGGDNRNVLGGCTSTNRAETGQTTLGIGATVTNYAFGGGHGQFSTYNSVPAGQLLVTTLLGDASRPTAEITVVIGNAISGSASQTIGLDELQVYSYQAS